MRNLWIKGLLFCVPPAAVMAFPAWVFFASGEFVLPARIAEIQGASAKPTLILQAYSDFWPFIKLRGTVRRGPEALALGSSRVMQFRDYMFRESFFNAGGSVNTIANFRKFVEQLPEAAAPRLLIVGLDQNFFNHNWSYLYANLEVYSEPGQTDLLRMFAMRWHRTYRDFYLKKFHFKRLFRPEGPVHRIGLSAIALGQGYRDDGSFRYPAYLRRTSHPSEAAENKAFSRDLAAIRKNEGVYVGGEELSDAALQELEAFLALCKRRGIRVLGFLPPYAPRVYAAMQKRGERYAYLAKIPEAVRPIFQKYGYAFFDWTDPASLGLGEREYIDGQHGSERVYSVIAGRLAEAEDPSRTIFAGGPEELLALAKAPPHFEGAPADLQGGVRR